MRRLVALLVALVALTAGCKVDSTVTVDMHDDGSGVITVMTTLDADAVHAAESGNGKLEDRVRLSDLSNAGWTVSPWTRKPSGEAQISASKNFASPEQVPAIINEISGPNGPLRDFKATRDRGLTSTDYTVSGAIDLAAIGTGVTSDQDLVKALTNAQVDPNAIDQQLLAELKTAVTVDVVVKLPGGQTSTVKGVAGQRVPVEASTSVLNTRRFLLLGVAVVLVIAAIGVLFIGRRRRRARAPLPHFSVHSKRGETMR
jgi:hypothetical protein